MNNSEPSGKTQDPTQSINKMERNTLDTQIINNINININKRNK
jgi:hypothetical protein